LAKLAEARAKIEARARERFEREQAEHEAKKLAAREARIKQTGRKLGGKPPEPPTPGARPSDQINLTDEQSRVMPALSEAEGPMTGGGFDQCYNAQAAVAVGSLPVVATDVVQALNDKQQLEPVFGIIKSVLGFRQFSLRGLDKVRGEWNLVTLAWNIKRMFALKPAAKPLVAPSCAIQALPTAASDQANPRKSPIDRLSACCRTIAAALRPTTFSPTGC